MDQAFSQQAALICRHIFDTPEQVATIMDTLCRSDVSGERERKKQKTHKVEAYASKLDEVADWKEWVGSEWNLAEGFAYLGTDSRNI